MATQAHCAFCFDSLAASFEHRQPLGLTQIEELWEEYQKSKSGDHNAEDEELSEDERNEDEAEMTDADAEEPPTLRPAAISRLLNRDPSAASSSSSLPSTRSTTSSVQSRSGSGVDTPASSTSSVASRSSLFSFARRRREKREAHPLFVTWNTVSRSGYKSLRGCIGTFEPQELEYGLRSYSLTRYGRLPLGATHVHRC